MLKLFIRFLIVSWCSDVTFGQRDFVNPAITDPAPCSCNLRSNKCDPNCCCDPDCSSEDIAVFPACNSVRTTSDYITSDEALRKWNCSNTTTAAAYDYFPFVCVQMGLNENAGQYRMTRSVPFIKSITDASSLRTAFVTNNQELFQSSTVTSSNTKYNGPGAPIRSSANTILTLPGSVTGTMCQENVPVLFGVNRDVTCPSSSLLTTPLCTRASGITSILPTGEAGSSIPIFYYTKTYSGTTNTTAINSGSEYYFQNNPPTVDSIPTQNIDIIDYCPGRYPTNRTQRYFFCSSLTDCVDQYRTHGGCPSRPSLTGYTSIPSTFFNAPSASTDDETNFADFTNPTNVSILPCTNGVRRIYIRFNYYSTDNSIASADIYALLETTTITPTYQRITIVWNDISSSSSSATTIPRGYNVGEALQFRRNDASSDVANLVPGSNGFCIDATRQVLRYKKDTMSTCNIQVRRSTIEQCHTLKLNMYLYLNTIYAPAADVMAYPSTNAAAISLRDTAQESLDLDRIDVTREKNRLSLDTIRRTRLNATSYTVYDASQDLSVCFDVPSGLYIEFGFVRVRVSSTFSYERIVTVKMNYTFSNWRFECLETTCENNATDQFPVTFQTAFVDYTNLAFYLGESTRADVTSADNYIQHLLWMISPEYKGEPGYRNYTIAMILVFTAICVIVMHVLLFGLMFPF